MAAPTTPSLAELASMGESAALAEIAMQARRCVTKKAGTPDTTPSLNDMRGMAPNAIYPHIVLALRQLEDLLP